MQRLKLLSLMANVTLSRKAKLRLFSLAIASGTLCSPAFAQLRTGRESDREFYDSRSEVEVAAPAVKVSAKRSSTNKSSVQLASATQEVEHDAKAVPSRLKSAAPTRLVSKPKIHEAKRSTATVTTPAVSPAGATSATSAYASSVKRAVAGESHDSKVVKASCPNCQAGVAHSHPIAADSHEVVREEVDTHGHSTAYESGLGDEVYDSSNFQFAACPDYCGGTGYRNANPLMIAGGILMNMHLRVEAATFWPDGRNLAPLVTTRRPAADPTTDGLVGRADTTNLFGGSEVLGDATQGLRGELGSYFDATRTNGFVLRFFDVGNQSEKFSSTPTSEAVVMRPYLDITTNTQDTIAVNYPNSTSGTLNAEINSDLYGGDILFRHTMRRGFGGQLELLVGYQTARLDENLVIDSTTTALTNVAVPAGTVSELRDSFSTSNRFNGFAIGLSSLLRRQNWTMSGMAKLGLGNMESLVSIDGTSRITVPGNPQTVNASTNGLLARSTNNGDYTFDTFVVSPEVNLTLGYRLTPQLEATVGYSFLGLPKVARVADQLDPNIASNLSNPPAGALRPSFSLVDSNFSLHSLNYGLQFRY